MRYCVTVFATDGGTSLAKPTSLILATYIIAVKQDVGWFQVSSYAPEAQVLSGGGTATQCQFQLQF
ncbi:hypothetical protein SESBI_22679 [Sesbania bispinosa]|nr:hypothetical protein SESBI_22679 [Sesbania bispinosa]